MPRLPARLPAFRRRLALFAAAATALGVPAWAAHEAPGAPSAAPPSAPTPPVPLFGAAPLPLGISPEMMRLALPANYAATAEQAALGERLFFDKRLSVNDQVSCATCHVPSEGFVDHKAKSDGVYGRDGQRNTPTVLNAMFHASQFWDGRAKDLEEQAKLPILNPVEMGMKDGHAVEVKLAAVPAYAADFARLYGKLDFASVAHAIAAYERTQASGNSPFDHFVAGESDQLDPQARRGWALFNGKARCNACHAFNRVSSLFSDQKFHNIGISAHKTNFSKLARQAEVAVQTANKQQIDELALQTDYSELGRYLVTKQRHDIGAFKTETLRNIGITAPYMHDGSLPTLWDVVDHYNRGGLANPYLDGGIQRLGLTEPEIDDLVAFLFTLTDARYRNLNRAERQRQEALRQKARPQRNTAAAMGTQGDFGDVGADADLKNPANIGAL